MKKSELKNDETSENCDNKNGSSMFFQNEQPNCVNCQKPIVKPLELPDKNGKLQEIQEEDEPLSDESRFDENKKYSFFTKLGVIQVVVLALYFGFHYMYYVNSTPKLYEMPKESFLNINYFDERELQLISLPEQYNEFIQVEKIIDPNDFNKKIEFINSHEISAANINDGYSKHLFNFDYLLKKYKLTK